MKIWEKAMLEHIDMNIRAIARAWHDFSEDPRHCSGVSCHLCPIRHGFCANGSFNEHFEEAKRMLNEEA